MKDAETRTALKISLFYLFAVELWDILSDMVLTGPVYHLENLSLPLIMKDAAFTICSATFIFWILRRELRKRKATEIVLQESEERFRSIYEHSLDAIFLTRPDGNILAANPAACRILGRTEQEICDIGRAGIVDFSDPNATAALEERQKTGQFFRNVALIHKNGSRIPMEVTSSVFIDKEGNQRTSMIARDISGRKQVERDLQEYQTRLQMLLEKIPALLWTTDTNLRYTSLVGAALASIGVRPDQAIGKSVGTPHPPEKMKSTWCTNSISASCKAEPHLLISNGAVTISTMKLSRCTITTSRSSAALGPRWISPTGSKLTNCSSTAWKNEPAKSTGGEKWPKGCVKSSPS